MRDELKEENNVHGPVTGAEVVELNQRVATVLEPVAKAKTKATSGCCKGFVHMKNSKSYKQNSTRQYVASDGMGIFDAAALLGFFLAR